MDVSVYILKYMHAYLHIVPETLTQTRVYSQQVQNIIRWLISLYRRESYYICILALYMLVVY